MEKRNEIIDNLIKTARRKKVNFNKPDKIIGKIYQGKNTYYNKVDLLEAYKIYSDYCDPKEIEFNMEQEIEIMEGIILGIDYTLYMNRELSANIMKRVKELLVMGVDIKKTLGRDIVRPEDSLYILDILVRVKKGEELCVE